MSKDNPDPGSIRNLVQAARAMAASGGEDGKHAATPAHAGIPETPDTFPGYSDPRILQAGGQGVVYCARQEGTNRLVAIKVLRSDDDRSDSLRRFEREIELVGGFRHPSIVHILHSGLTASGRMFFVMDYVAGKPLRDFVRQDRARVGDVIDLVIRVCDGVQYAHQRGVIHRDLKPSNILVDDDGNPHILDFGLARRLEQTQEEELTMTGEVMGTLPYMAPEQVRADHEAIDTRTDVYALGVMLYELIVGQHPYPVAGRIVDVARNIAEQPPGEPSRNWDADCGAVDEASRTTCPIDLDLQTILLRSLAKEPARRYQSVGELGRDLQRFRTGEPIEARRDSFWYVISKLARRNRRDVAALAAVLVILGSALTLIGWYAAQAGRAEGERAEIARKFEFESSDLDARLAATWPPVLHAFIAEWRAKRLDSAQYMLQLLPPDAAESLAARLLLGNEPATQVHEALADRPDLAWYVLGERAAAADRSSEALVAFKKSLASKPAPWLSATLPARIAQLSAQPESEP